MGGIDLSVGSVMSLTTVVAASYTMIGGNNTLNLAIVLLIGLGFGLANGVGIVLGINPLIMTLSTLAIAKGIALLILSSPGGTLSDQMNALIDLSWGNVPFFFIFAAVLALVIWYAVSSSPWGLRVYAVGASVSNAARSGINWRRTTITTYALSGLLASVAGLALLGRVYSGDPLAGDPYALDSITAVVLGGIALTGGRGSVLGAVAGAMLLALVDNLMNTYSVYSYYQYVIRGVILVAALVLYNVGGLNPATLVPITPRWLGALQPSHGPTEEAP
jgi:ribose transport system permease protein